MVNNSFERKKSTKTNKKNASKKIKKVNHKGVALGHFNFLYHKTNCGLDWGGAEVTDFEFRISVGRIFS